MSETERFSFIKEQIRELSGRKIRIEERFENEKKNLEKLLKEITEKGYDPKKLTKTREEKENTLQEKLTELEKQIEETKTKLNSIEV